MVKRPWGHFRLLFRGKGVWLKKLSVRGGATSLQRHHQRDELWLIYVPTGTVHRIEGRGDLLEVALGVPKESDVERLSDLYSRANTARRANTKPPCRSRRTKAKTPKPGDYP